MSESRILVISLEILILPKQILQSKMWLLMQVKLNSVQVKIHLLVLATKRQVMVKLKIHLKVKLKRHLLDLGTELKLLLVILKLKLSLIIKIIISVKLKLKDTVPSKNSKTKTHLQSFVLIIKQPELDFLICNNRSQCNTQNRDHRWHHKESIYKTECNTQSRQNRDQRWHHKQQYVGMNQVPKTSKTLE